MPRIDQRIIQSTFYLYENADDARSGRNAKGTGFIVAHRGNPRPGLKRWDHIYGVTNQHVASQFPVVRLNRVDGPEIVDLGPEDWDFHPAGDDVAIVALGPPMGTGWHTYPGSLKAISSDLFIAKPGDGAAEKWNPKVAVGDDVFMVGLFVDHEGKEENNPLARFGNVSMVANESAMVKRRFGDGREMLQLSYILDMHSRSGYSGSPVFAYRTFGSDLTEDKEYVQISSHEWPVQDTRARGTDAQFSAEIRTRSSLLLLGVHWGQFPERYQLQAGQAALEASIDPSNFVADGSYVAGYSGMTLVVPAWKIMELLEISSVGEKRRRAESEAESGDPLAERAD